MSEPTRITVSDYEVVRTMLRYGGSFVQALAACFDTADADNIARLKKAFPEYWAEYRDMAVLVKQQQDAAR